MRWAISCVSAVTTVCMQDMVLEDKCVPNTQLIEVQVDIREGLEQLLQLLILLFPFQLAVYPGYRKDMPTPLPHSLDTLVQMRKVTRAHPHISTKVSSMSLPSSMVHGCSVHKFIDASSQCNANRPLLCVVLCCVVLCCVVLCCVVLCCVVLCCVVLCCVVCVG